jgi:MFS family permease
VLASLLALGRLSDLAGRRFVLFVAAALAVTSTVVFLVAMGLVWLLAGRFLSGLAVGTLTSAGTAVLAELEPKGDRKRASLVAAIATSGGLAAGTLVAGILAQFGPLPLRLVFLIYLGALGAMSVGTFLLPETVPEATGHLDFRATRLHVPSAMVRSFVAAALGVLAAFTVLGLFAALAPSFLRQSLGDDNLFVAGLVVAIVYGAAATASLTVGRLSIVVAAVIGACGVIAGLGLVLVALATASLTAFFVGALLVGLGAGSLFVSTLAVVNRDAPSMRRAEVVSAYYFVAYSGISVLIIGLGIATRYVSVFSAAAALTAVVVTLTLAGLWGATRSTSSRTTEESSHHGEEGQERSE